MNINEILKWASAVVVVVVVAIFGGHTFGAITSPATNFDFVQFSQGIQLPAGPSIPTTSWGSQLQGLFQGTCNATSSAASLAATSTGQFLCNVPGVLAGDHVQVMLPAGARTAANMWFSAFDGYATTTGVIGFDIANFTGTATTSFAQATTGVQYLITR